jgi:hypothetical protein
MRRNEEMTAKELDIFLTILQARQQLPPPLRINTADTSVVDSLLELTNTIELDQTFADDLKQKLIRKHKSSHTPVSTPMWRRWLTGAFMGKAVAPTLVGFRRTIAFIMLLGVLLVAVPVVAQTALEYFVPREVKELPPIQATYEPPPTTARLMEIAQLEELAGFTIIVPTYLPSACVLAERFFVSGPRVVYLNYSCVSIAQQRAQTVHQPHVGENSVQKVTVNGKPAVYINGIWVVMPGSDERIWAEGVIKELTFEHDGLLVRMQTDQLSKEELLRIAESLE